MSRLLFAWLVFLTLPVTLSVLPATSRAQEDRTVAGDDDLVQKVKKSIDEGVSFLRSQQRKTDGSWELGAGGGGVAGGMSGTGGWTALVILALLNSGVKPDDEAIQRGLQYLRRKKPTQTYIVA